MNQKVNVALQILPNSESKHPYALVDKAIEVIKASGISYRVCPFETVMEGNYHEIMELVEKVHKECYAFGADNIIAFLKIQTNKDQDVTIEDKMGKYE